jgi:ribonuclease HI
MMVVNSDVHGSHEDYGHRCSGSHGKPDAMLPTSGQIPTSHHTTPGNATTHTPTTQTNQECGKQASQTTHPTPLHNLMHRYNIQPQNIKTIKAVRYDTRWRPGIMTEIIVDADKAIEAIARDHPDIKVFTDGSGMEGKVGAGAVLYRNGRLKTKIQHQLGPIQHHTVYEGEGVGALLGVKLISNEWGIWLVNIYIDNQASIAAMSLTKPNPGHYIFDAIQDSIMALQKKHSGIKIKVKWVPGHKGVEGNENADEQAKKGDNGRKQ